MTTISRSAPRSTATMMVAVLQVLLSLGVVVPFVIIAAKKKKEKFKFKGGI